MQQETKPRYIKVVTLKQEDNDLLKKINEGGIKTIEVFRLGLQTAKKKLKIK